MRVQETTTTSSDEWFVFFLESPRGVNTHHLNNGRGLSLRSADVEGKKKPQNVMKMKKCQSECLRIPSPSSPRGFLSGPPSIWQPFRTQIPIVVRTVTIQSDRWLNLTLHSQVMENTGGRSSSAPGPPLSSLFPQTQTLIRIWKQKGGQHEFDSAFGFRSCSFPGTTVPALESDAKTRSYKEQRQ